MKNEIDKIIGQFSHKPLLMVNKIELEEVICALFNLLFPVCINNHKRDINKVTYQIYERLLNNVKKIEEAKDPVGKIEVFFERLPMVQEQLYQDADNFYKNDPAAYSIEEIILTYPGFYALAVHRIAHGLYEMKIPIIPRLWSEYVHTKAGIDIHPGAVIGDRFFLDHGTGVVIGQTCVIGNNVKVYQNVTLGALHVTKDMQDKKRHPTVQDNVIIYSGATILGGQTTIGHGTIIGGNVWLTESVEPFSVVYHTHQMRRKTTKDYKQPINFVI